MPSTWSKLYLRDAAPEFSPGETELSTALPVGLPADLGGSVKSLSPYKGAAVASVAGLSLASTSHQDNFFTSFSSPPLAAGEYGGGTWNYQISCSEASAVANSFFAFSIYVFRPSTASIVGFIYDSDTALGTEWALTQEWRTGSFTGAGVTAQNGDILVVEVWRHATQDKGSAVTQTIYYDGTIDSTATISEPDAASWVQAPQEIGFKPRLRGVGVN